MFVKERDGWGFELFGLVDHIRPYRQRNPLFMYVSCHAMHSSDDEYNVPYTNIHTHIHISGLARKSS